MKSKTLKKTENNFKLKSKIIYLLIGFITFSLSAQNSSKQTANFNLEDGIAIQGYDPVSYFKQGKAVKGKKELTTTYEGVIYQFSSVTNKNIFIKSPASYKPQYGGWCAYALGKSGEKVEINPETFKIIDGKLYLFYNAYFNNTLKSWNKDEDNLKTKANANWSKIIK